MKVQQPQRTPDVDVDKAQDEGSSTRVQREQSLEDIAREHGTTEDELLRLNPQLRDVELKAGQEIRLPEKADAARVESAQQRPLEAANAYERSDEAPAPLTARPSTEEAELPAADARAQALADERRASLQVADHDVTGSFKKLGVEQRLDVARSRADSIAENAEGIRSSLQDAVKEARASRDPAVKASVPQLAEQLRAATDLHARAGKLKRNLDATEWKPDGAVDGKRKTAESLKQRASDVDDLNRSARDLAGELKEAGAAAEKNPALKDAGLAKTYRTTARRAQQIVDDSKSLKSGLATTEMVAQASVRKAENPSQPVEQRPAPAARKSPSSTSLPVQQPSADAAPVVAKQSSSRTDVATLARPTTEKPAAIDEPGVKEGPPEPLTEADAEKLGSAYDDKHPASQALWNEHAINSTLDAAKQQGLISDEKLNEAAPLATRTLEAEGRASAPAEKMMPATLAAAVREAGVPLEKQDPAQLVAATNYINEGKTVGEQAERLRKSIATFNVISDKGMPKLGAQETKDLLFGAAKIPGHALGGLSDDKVQAAFQRTASAINNPGKSEFKVGSHEVKLDVSENNKVTSSDTHKPTILNKIGGALKKAMPVIAVAANFIPGVGTAVGIGLKIASAAMSTVDAIKAKNPLGIVAGIASGITGGAAAIAGKATAGIASTTARIAGAVQKTAQGIQQGIEAARAKSVSGLFGAAASVASAGAGFIGKAAGSLSTGLGKFANFARGGSAVAGGIEAGVKGDFAGALSSGISGVRQIAGTAGATGLSDALRDTQGFADVASGVQSAIKRKDFLGAAQGISEFAAKKVDDPVAKERLAKTGRVLQGAGDAQAAIKHGDLLGAADAATTMAREFTDNGAIHDVGNVLSRAGALRSAVKRGDPEAIQLATRDLRETVEDVAHRALERDLPSEPLPSRAIGNGMAELPAAPLPSRPIGDGTAQLPASVTPNQPSSTTSASTTRAATPGSIKPSQDVEIAQRLLNERAGESLAVDGKLGSATGAALKRYQAREGLAVTGKADADTMKRLETAPSSSSTTVKPPDRSSVRFRAQETIDDARRASLQIDDMHKADVAVTKGIDWATGRSAQFDAAQQKVATRTRELQSVLDNPNATDKDITSATGLLRSSAMDARALIEERGNRYAGWGQGTAAVRDASVTAIEVGTLGASGPLAAGVKLAGVALDVTGRVQDGASLRSALVSTATTLAGEQLTHVAEAAKYGVKAAKIGAAAADIVATTYQEATRRAAEKGQPLTKAELADLFARAGVSNRVTAAMGRSLPAGVPASVRKQLERAVEVGSRGAIEGALRSFDHQGP